MGSPTQLEHYKLFVVVHVDVPPVLSMATITKLQNSFSMLKHHVSVTIWPEPYINKFKLFFKK